MSNFLDNLAARSLELADTAQPRLASRFEPVKPVVFSGGALSQNESLDDSPSLDWRSTEIEAAQSVRSTLPGPVHSVTESADQSDRTDDASSHRQNHISIRPTLSVTSARDADETETRTGHRFKRSTTSARQTTLGEISIGAESAPQSNQSENEILRQRDQSSIRPVANAAGFYRRDQPEPLAKSELEESIRRAALSIAALWPTASPIAAEQKAEPPLSGSPVVAGRKDQESDGILRPHPIQPAFRSTESGADTGMKLVRQPAKKMPETSEKVVAEPRVSFYVESRRDDRAELPSPAPDPPVINVTIGRIEVRANVVASSSPGKRPAPKTMSLDEYMRQRANGGRR